MLVTSTRPMPSRDFHTCRRRVSPKVVRKSSARCRSFLQVSLPLIDEEYFEQVAVYQSVLRAEDSFHAMELGARWGTWGARAVALLRLRNPMPYQLFYVEHTKVHCKGLWMVMKLNNMSAHLHCTAADVPLLLHLLSSTDHLDILHADIQSAEDELLTDVQVKEAIDRSVYRVIVGTHSEDIHRRLTDVFMDWITVFNLPYGFGHCIRPLKDPNYRNAGTLPSREFWTRLRGQGCYHNTPQGGRHVSMPSAQQIQNLSTS